MQSPLLLDAPSPLDLHPRAVLARYRGALITVGVLSAAVNLLMLTGPLFMLQIYDRVLTSRAEATLVALLAIVVYLYGLKGLLDALRGRILSRVGAGFQSALDERVFDAASRAARGPSRRGNPGQALQDLETVRTFLASPAPGALLDLPWTPFFVAVIFIFHTLLGWLAVAGGVVLMVLALVNRWVTRKSQARATQLSAEAAIRAEDVRREMETVTSLGMAGPLRARWKALREAALDQAMQASDAGGGYTSASKAFRLLLQSGMLALGAWLVLQNELTAGAMIAASILLGRALQPLEQTIAQSALMQRARAGWQSVSRLLAEIPPEASPMALPRPAAHLRVRDLTILSPSRRELLLRGVSFEAGPGEAVAVVGPSGAGKSTLAKALAGLWPIAQGEIRLGGAELSAWGEALWREHLGYLPQEVTLFAGSVAENIARFYPGADEETVVRAARAAGAHEMILSLPGAYDTMLAGGNGGVSGGQRQRIGLARALYGDPALLVLDEPDASLDDAGTWALNRAIAGAKAAGRAVVVMAHRRSVLAECARIVVLDGGRLQVFGPSEKVLARLPGARRPRLTAAPPEGRRPGVAGPTGGGDVPGPSDAPERERRARAGSTGGGNVPDPSDAPEVERKALAGSTGGGGVPGPSDVPERERASVAGPTGGGDVPDPSDVPERECRALAGSAGGGEVPDPSDVPERERRALAGSAGGGEVPDPADVPERERRALAGSAGGGEAPDPSDVPERERKALVGSTDGGGVPGPSDVPERDRTSVVGSTGGGGVPDPSDAPAGERASVAGSTSTGSTHREAAAGGG